MRQAVVLRKLEETQDRLERARVELAVLDEQFEALDQAAEELRIRNLLSETPQSSHDYAEMCRAADTLERARTAVRKSLEELHAARAELLQHVESST